MSSPETDPESTRSEVTGNPLHLQVFNPESPQAVLDSTSAKENHVQEFLRRQGRRYVRGLFEDDHKYRGYRQGEIQKRLERRSYMDRFARAYLVKGLGSAGIQRPEEVVSVIEHHVDIRSYFDIRGGDVVKVLGKLGEEQEAARKLAVGLERFEKMHLFPSVKDLRQPEFSGALENLANVSEETFQEVFKTLNSYDFLHTLQSISYGDGKLTPDCAELIAILQNGGLTEDQKQKLDDENLYAHTTGVIPIIQEKRSKNQMPQLLNLTEALNPGENLMELYRPFVVDFANSSIEQEKRNGEIQILAGPALMDILEYMHNAGKLPLLKAFLDSGWNCMGVYKAWTAVYPRPEKAELATKLEKAAVFFADADKVGWAQRCSNALWDITRLHPTWVDTYEALYENKEKLTDVFDIIAALPDSSKPEFAEIVNIEKKYGKDEVRVNIQSQAIVINAIQELSTNDELTVQDTCYARLLRSLFKSSSRWDSRFANLQLKVEDLSLLAAVARNMDILAPTLDSTDQLPAAFVERVLSGNMANTDLTKGLIQICADPENFSPAFAWSHMGMFTDNQTGFVVSALPQDFVQTLSEAEQALIDYSKRSTRYDQTFLWKNLGRVEEFFINGVPTAQFFQTAVEGEHSGRKFMVADAPDIVDGFPYEVFNSFPSGQKEFWVAYKRLPRLARPLLFANRDRYGEFFINGGPTAAFLNEVAGDNRAAAGILPILEMADTNSFSGQDKEFWQYFPTLPLEERTLLLRNMDRFSKLVVDGKPTPAFLYEAAVAGDSVIATRNTGKVDWDRFRNELAFWSYYVRCPDNLRLFVCRNKDRFSEFVADGKETPIFYRTLSEQHPVLFVQISEREQWRMAFGEEPINQFLDALPVQTDEKRNAFTHNQYDRTSQFIDYMLANTSKDFGLNQEDFGLLTQYVKRFGFSRTTRLFHYFKNLYLFEQGKINQLPKDVEESGLQSVQEMIDQIVRIKGRCYSEIPMTDLSGLSNFEIDLLRFITGKGTHRWDYVRPPIERIIQDFQKDITEGGIELLPPQYHTEILSASNVRIELNTEAIGDDYHTLKDEILASIQNPNDIDGLKGIVGIAVQRKVEEIRRVASLSEGKKLEFMTKESARLEQYLSSLDTIKDLDSLMGNLLEMNFDKTEQKVINSVFRRIIFGKIFQKHTSPGFIQEIQRQLEGGISAASIESIINVVDEMAKIHALNMGGNNKERYWTDEAFAKIKGSKRGKSLPHSFSPHIGKLREEVEHFQKIQTGASNQVRAIPDRGFVGEMSGYLADVCYTAEYPLLKKYPNVIPYKFVTVNPETGDPQFIGSVLIFELDDAEGNPSLLVRAFDVPNESAIDINSFIEQFLDRVAKVGQARGKNQVLVPGNPAAVSNYQMTINHMSENYTAGRTAVSLADRFVFNGYNLTNDCFVARKIET